MWSLGIFTSDWAVFANTEYRTIQDHWFISHYSRHFFIHRQGSFTIKNRQFKWMKGNCHSNWRHIDRSNSIEIHLRLLQIGHYSYYFHVLVFSKLEFSWCGRNLWWLAIVIIRAYEWCVAGDRVHMVWSCSSYSRFMDCVSSEWTCGTSQITIKWDRPNGSGQVWMRRRRWKQQKCLRCCLQFYFYLFFQ